MLAERGVIVGDAVTEHSISLSQHLPVTVTELTAEASVLVAVLLSLLLLPLLVLLDAPLPSLLPLQIHAVLLSVRLQTQSLRQLPLLLQALKLLGGDLRLLVVLDEIFAVRGC
jgi:hypothetical protein